MERRTFLRGAAVWAAASCMLASPSRAAPGRFEEVLLLLKQASPTGYRIVAGQLAAPERFQIGTTTVTVGKPDPAVWLDVLTQDRLVTACNTMVHETCHSFCRLKALSLGVTSPGLAVFPSADRTILVPGTTSTFPSAQAGPTMLPGLRATRRFSTYIAPGRPEHATQQDGIYGLLNEFAAYYVGNQTAYDLIVHKAKAPDLSGGAWLEHISGLSGTITSHQEFRGFILSYLLFASRNNPSIFVEMTSNQKLLEGYGSIDKAHTELCRRWFSYLPELVEQLNQDGIPMRLSGDHIFHNNSGRGLAISEYRKLARMIDSDPELRAIEKAL